MSAHTHMYNTGSPCRVEVDDSSQTRSNWSRLLTFAYLPPKVPSPAFCLSADRDVVYHGGQELGLELEPWPCPCLASYVTFSEPQFLNLKIGVIIITPSLWGVR